MKPIDQILSGLRAYRRSFGIIKQCSLGRYFVLPIVVNVLLMILFLILGIKFGDSLSNLWSAEGSSWLGAAQVAVQWLLPIISFILFIFIGGQIVILIMSPIYSIISEKVDTAITGREYSTSAKQIAKDIWRTLLIVVKNTIIQLALTVLFMLLNFIPIVGSVVSVVLIFIVNAYFFGYSFMDYTNERYRRSVGDSSRVVWHYKYLSFIIGVFYALPMYMFCGTFVAAFIGGVATVAATISQIELEGNDLEINTLIHKA